MKKFIVIITSILIGTCLTSCGSVSIDWSDFIQFDNIKYTQNSFISAEEKVNIILGPVAYTVKKKLSGVVKNQYYKTRNGDAAFHEIGTEVFSVQGYSRNYRLAIVTQNGIELYESYSNEKAKKGIDYLDIEGKVEYITINDESNGKDVVTEIRDAKEVFAIVNSMLNAEVIYEKSIKDFSRCIVEFHLIDGTSSTLSYFINEGVIGQGMMISNNTIAIFEKYTK